MITQNYQNVSFLDSSLKRGGVLAMFEHLTESNAALHFSPYSTPNSAIFLCIWQWFDYQWTWSQISDCPTSFLYKALLDSYKPHMVQFQDNNHQTPPNCWACCIIWHSGIWMQNSVLFDFALSLIADDVLSVCAFAGMGAAEAAAIEEL